MFQKIKAKLKNKKAFTLVELLVVIAVLGVIAAIVAPRYLGVVDSTKQKADVRTAELLAKGVEAEFVLEDWAVDASNGLTVTGGGTATDQTTYSDAFPTSQVSGNAMVVKITGTPGAYKISITNGATTPLPLVTDKPIADPVK